MNCIKCGREIPDGELFCAECSLTSPAGREPAPRHPAKTARLPEREATAALPGQPGSGRQKSDSEPRRPRGLIVALVVVCLIAAGSIAFLALNYGKFAIQKANLRVREADLALRENEADELEQQLADVQSQLAAAQKNLEQMEETVSELQAQLHGSESSMTQAQYDMTSQQQKLEKLTGENTELLSMVDSLESQIGLLNDQIAGLKTSSEAYKEKADFMDSYVVFVNNDGSKVYHRYDCPEFKKDSFWAYSRKLAESNGYTACPICGG